MRPRLVFASLLLAIAAPAHSQSPLSREQGAYYLSDFDVKPIRVNLTKPAIAYFDIGMSRYAGTLRYPQSVEVTALSDGAYKVKAFAQQGRVNAWVPPDAIDPVNPELLANLKKSEERRKVVDALIAKNEVAIGMTVTEVEKSLGKPQKRTNRADKDGTQQIWEYIKYELVPQTTYVPSYPQTYMTTVPGKANNIPIVVQTGGGLVPATTYVKTPIGKLTITFDNGVVESLDQSEGTVSNPSQSSIVVPPIIRYW